jgi:hypothetical protein
MQPFYFKCGKYYPVDYSTKVAVSEDFIPHIGWGKIGLTYKFYPEEARADLNKARVVGIYWDENHADERGNNTAFTDNSHSFKQAGRMKGFVNHWRAAFAGGALGASRTAAGGQDHAVLPV